MAYREQNAASNITYSPEYPLTSTEVQSALNELLSLTDSGKYQDPIIDIQTDATLDPGLTPATGDRYLLEDTAALNANFGTITGVGNDDIVEYDGSDFVITYDASAQGEGGITWNESDNQFYVFDGAAWVTLASILASPGDVNLNTSAISSGPYSVLATDQFLVFDVLAASITVNLETSPADGHKIIIKDNGSASGTNKIIIDPGAGRGIDFGGNDVNFEIDTPNTSLSLVYQASSDEWYLV